jgi:hypothetical protein
MAFSKKSDHEIRQNASKMAGEILEGEQKTAFGSGIRNEDMITNTPSFSETWL